MNISKKISFAVIIILTSVSLSGCGVSKQAATSTIRDEKWLQDIDYLQKNLPEDHVNLYHRITMDQFNQEINDLKKDVPDLADYQIKCRLAQIIASVGDAHTNLLLFPRHYYRYPIKLWWFEDDLRVIKVNDPKYSELFGKKLISINGVPVNQIMNNINSLISHENNQWLRALNVAYITMPDVLKYFHVSTEDRSEFSFCGDNGQMEKISLSPERITPYYFPTPKELIPNKSLQPDPKNPYAKYYWFKYIPDGRILYFQYNTCIDRDIAQMYGYKNWQSWPDFNQFSNKLIKAVNSNDVDKLIIDLRCNTGGNSSLMYQLAGKLSGIAKLHGKGKVFVIIGRTTFSSGVWAAVDIKYRFPNATVYGEPTGGNDSGYGNNGILILPNSRMKIAYSKNYFTSYEGYMGEFFPDVVVHQSFADYAKGIDDTYEAIKNYHP